MEHELIYTSCATREMSEKDLIELLEQSREKNARLNITGLLLYGKREFAQLLEGDKNEIFKLYDTIVKDDRHHHVDLFWESKIERKSFKDWSMAFLNINDIDKNKLKAYSEFLQEGISSLNLTGDKSRGRQLMIGMRDSFL